MKLQLIMTEPPIVVSDSQPVKGSYFDAFVGKIRDTGTAEYGEAEHCKQVIAGVHKLPYIDFSSLSEEDCKKIGYVDIFALAENKYPLENMLHMFYTNIVRTGFVEGFKLAQQMNDKKYSEEEVKMAIKMATYINPINTSRFFNEEEIIQSLKQPRVYDIEVEMERVEYPKNEGWEDVYYPKITNNSIKITKVL